MILHLINPNSTAAMTEKARIAAESVAGPQTRILARNPSTTPVSIEGYADEAISLPAMLAGIRAAEAEGASAHIIACFDDPGLKAARELATGPVIGICQASVQVAMTIASRFSIVTTLPRSIPIIEDLVHEYGAGHRCRRVRAADLPVLALEDDAGHAFEAIAAEIERARDEDRAEAVILGCAGMADLVEALQQRTGVPVIDGVIAAVSLAESLVGAGFVTSKVGAYALPRMKQGSILAAG